MRSLILLFVASTRALEMPYLAAATMAPKCRLIFNRSSRKAGIRHSVFCVQLPGLLRGSKGTVLAQRENHCPALRLSLIHILHITEIAKACKHPERFMGQHWLNPPHLLPLCEIIAGEKTSQENLQKMRELVIGLGKQPVIVKDINGFIINRIQFAVLREALHIVDMGAATIEDVDTVLKAGMGLRYAALGPFGVADFGGLDTFDHINLSLIHISHLSPCGSACES